MPEYLQSTSVCTIPETQHDERDRSSRGCPRPYRLCVSNGLVRGKDEDVVVAFHERGHRISVEFQDTLDRKSSETVPIIKEEFAFGDIRKAQIVDAPNQVVGRGDSQSASRVFMAGGARWNGRGSALNAVASHFSIAFAIDPQRTFLFLGVLWRPSGKSIRGQTAKPGVCGRPQYY